MSFNFLNFGGRIIPNNQCFYDSNLGYSAIFTQNGNIDGWTYYDGIHTYGCWNSFLFGTLYKTYGLIGRSAVFPALAAENFYTIRLVMKLNFKERTGIHVLPTYGRIAWRTLSNTIWSSDKTLDFELNTDADWHTYTIDLSEAQWWQGDVNDLRIYPIFDDGVPGDEFFIKTIEIISNNSFKCKNQSCSYYNNYSHDCPGVGVRAHCKSQPLDAYIQSGTAFEFAETKLYNIVKDVNDTLLLNINGYGYERVKIEPVVNYSGSRLAVHLSKHISAVNIGGYAECDVEYTTQGEFIIHSGTYTDDSTVLIGDTQLARDLNFFSGSGLAVYSVISGTDPATGYIPYSSFKAKTHQLYKLLDSNDKTGFSFDPYLYNVEGGRRDWLNNGLGIPTKDVRGTESDDSGIMNRYIDSFDNAGKTIIDFNHPFNASGRIKKVYAAVTLDPVGVNVRGTNYTQRRDAELSDAKVMFFRPTRTGKLKVLPYEISINNRDYDSGNLYSSLQEYVELDCDIFVNKGDLIGIYNANVHFGRSITGSEMDAMYYQVNGKPSGILNVGVVSGQGSGGMMVYARSDQYQDRLVVSLDLEKRVNIEEVEVIGTPSEGTLDFNIARCIDVTWQVDLFGEDHTTGYVTSTHPVGKLYFNHPNKYYGKDCLDDGIYVVPDGLAADSFTVAGGTAYESYLEAVHKQDGGVGIVPTGARYFHCNGDEEWLGVYLHQNQAYFMTDDFAEDPIAFTLMFPNNEEKIVYKSKIYFKEQYNFRSFGISTYGGDYYYNGNADDSRFNYIPNRDGYDTPWVKLTIDGIDYTPEDTDRWETINLYLANNPCLGAAQIEINTVIEHTYDETLDYYTDDGGLQYTAAGTVLNNEQYTQATAIDWSTIEHEWEPIRTQGVRIYTDYHKSTKICEMEVYCQVENVQPTMTSSLEVFYSEYGDYWWTPNITDSNTGAMAFVGDNIRYIDIVVKPINELLLTEVNIDISQSDFYMGSKGCQHLFLPQETKVGYDYNKPEVLYFKNVYGQDYDLYVDIEKDDIKTEGVALFTLMSDNDSIENPEMGPSSYYVKHPEYILRNYQSNVAINCPVYALNNLVDGAKAWYSHDRDYSWVYFGELTGGQDVSFSNLPNSTITTINVPVLTRSKHWKLGFYDERVTTNVREVQVYYGGEQIEGVQFYHHKDSDVYTTPNNDTAPHLSNGVVDGSYYVLGGTTNGYIGFELPTAQEFDKIVFYHDTLLNYENSHDAAGIDIATGVCIHGEGDTFQTSSLIDMSYYEHEVTVVGSGIYCDETSGSDILYDFTQDFSDCDPYGETFDGPDIDTNVWTNIVNAYIDTGKLNITNSGIIGEVTTVDYFYGDFSAEIELDIEGAYSHRGWGCYLQAETDSGDVVRVGRTYHYEEPYHRLFSAEYGGTGWEDIEVLSTTYTTGLEFRIDRAGSTTSCYIKEPGGSWTSMGSSTVFGLDPVRFILMSDLTPLASGITTAKFDNFVVDKSDADWSVNTDYNSSFTCVSGIGPNGWAYQFHCACTNRSYAGGYKVPEIFVTQNKPLDETYAFILDFSFDMDQFLYSTSSSNNLGVAIGIFGSRVLTSSAYPWVRWWEGVQLGLQRDEVYVVVQNLQNVNVESTHVTMDPRTGPYFARLTGDGMGNYNSYIWSDTWNGSSLVASMSVSTNARWEANKVGVGAGFGSSINSTNYYADGWVSDFDFSCVKPVMHHTLHRSSIKFSGFENEKLLISYDNITLCNINKNPLDFQDKSFTIDFWLELNSLPTEEGAMVFIAKQWQDGFVPVAGSSAGVSSWALAIVRSGDTYYWKFFANIAGTCREVVSFEHYPDLYRRYHYYFLRWPGDESINYVSLIRDGYTIAYSRVYISGNYFDASIVTSEGDITVGENLDGWIEEFRISSDHTNESGGARVETTYQNCFYLTKSVPVKPYERYYTYSFFNSTDNIFFGKSMDVDVLFDNSYSYHEEFSAWGEQYYSYFAIDFGQRHKIDIVRTYPVDEAYIFDNIDNVLYSNKDTTDPAIAFSLSAEEQDVSTDFSGQNYDYPVNWTKLDSSGSVSYLIDDSFYQKCESGTSTYARAKSDFYFYGNFDFQIDYNLGTSLQSSNSWSVRLEITDINNSDFAIKFERAYINGAHQFTMWRKDDAASWTGVFTYYRQPLTQTLKLVRASNIFTAYVKEVDEPDSAFENLGSYQMLNGFGLEVEVNLYTQNGTSNYPTIQNWWGNFVVNYAEVLFSTKNDARWMRIKMLDGDGTTRTIKQLDVFPDTSIQTNAVGQYNTYWTSLGTAVTSYAGAENIALGATVSGSSYVGTMWAENAVDGFIYDGELGQVWGSDNEDNPWIAVYFNQIESIFRIKLYHGFDTTDSDNLITDYKIQVSTDGETFTTIFTITDNDEYERIHDLSTPVDARVVRLYVDGYDARKRMVFISNDDGFQFWSGAVLRQMEVYKYYGFTSINSEDTPIIAVDLQHSYFISGHELIGFDSEFSEEDWDNSSSNFAWSSSRLDDPKKVTFGEWGETPYYAKWVLVKRNTATHYPTVPSTYYPYTDTPDYLKHVIIQASADEAGTKPNPVEYHWMWRSSISTLATDYDVVADGNLGSRSLRIDYPGGTDIDHVRFIEGDHWGWDENCSWRDGFGINLYIEDINALDLTYGYFYLGGSDYTQAENEVIYKWNITTVSGLLHNGWNSLTLCFMYADDIDYTPITDYNKRDPRRLYSIKWGKAGILYRGTGDAFSMNLEGMYIARNYFSHAAYPGQRGLYLHGQEFLRTHIGEIDFTSLTVEFFVRSDWDWTGKDIYNDYRLRTLFHFTNINNDVFGACVSTKGLEVYYGNLLNDLNMFIVQGFTYDPTNLITHMAFVCSNDGSSIGSDGSTIRVYVNGFLAGKTNVTWNVSDNKYFTFNLGGQGLLAQKNFDFDPTASSVDAVVCRLKIHNFCKTEFTDSIEDSEENYRRALSKPSNFIEISKDNVTYHNIDSAELPFFFGDVAYNDSVPVWVRVKVPKGLTGVEKRTAKIIASWDIGV